LIMYSLVRTQLSRAFEVSSVCLQLFEGSSRVDYPARISRVSS
jgi:hypothetical protein